MVFAHAQDQGRTGACAHHAVRLVLVEHRHCVCAVQLRQRGLDGVKQVALVQAVHQVGDHFGVGLAVKDIAFGLQTGAQFIVVFDDAVMDQRNTALARAGAFAVAEMGVGVVHHRSAMGGPAGVCDARGALDSV